MSVLRSLSTLEHSCWSFNFYSQKNLSYFFLLFLYFLFISVYLNIFLFYLTFVVFLMIIFVFFLITTIVNAQWLLIKLLKLSSSSFILIFVNNRISFTIRSNVYNVFVHIESQTRINWYFHLVLEFMRENNRTVSSSFWILKCR